MSFEHFIARRSLHGRKGKENSGGYADAFSRPLMNIATWTIALGVAVMIMSVCILRGFQQEIRNKVVGFGSHITVRSYGWVNDYDEMGIPTDSAEMERLASLEGVRHVQTFAYKGGMLKTEEQIHGIILKGVDKNYDSSFFASNLVYGRLFMPGDSTASNEIIISQRLADMMDLDTGDKARTYFWSGDNYRPRAFTVVGVYNTDLDEFDNHYIIGDIRQIQKLNGWDEATVGGYEILIDNFDKLEDIAYGVKMSTRPEMAVYNIKEQQPSMFAWLELLNSNIVLILAIMAIVCSASVMSALLIMIFEKTSMIGVLKTLGSTNVSIRRIFIYKASRIIAKGILYGNITALILCLLQMKFHIVTLDSQSYSMDFVPIDLKAWYLVAISIATAAVCLLALLLPSTIIAKIQPAKTIRIE